MWIGTNNIQIWYYANHTSEFESCPPMSCKFWKWMTRYDLIFGQLQPNLESQLHLIYFLVDISCELGQIMSRYDLLYGIDEWFWAMFKLDWSKIELDQSSIFVDFPHKLAIITYYWWIICPCRCLGVCSAGSQTRNCYTSFTSQCVQWEHNNKTQLI